MIAAERVLALLLRRAITSHPDEELAVYAGEGAPSGGQTLSGESLAAAQPALYVQLDAAVESPDDLLWFTDDGGTTWARLLAGRPLARSENRALGFAGVQNGSTAGHIGTAAAVPYSIAGTIYNKTATGDLWDLSGETDTAADKYRAYALYLDAAGAASFAASSADGDTAAAALAALPAIPATKAVIGTFVAGLACDFDDAGGLAAQGTLYNGHGAALY